MFVQDGFESSTASLGPNQILDEMRYMKHDDDSSAGTPQTPQVVSSISLCTKAMITICVLVVPAAATAAPAEIQIEYFFLPHLCAQLYSPTSFENFC